MVLQRSASVRTTLSMVMKKTSKFQYFLSLFNVAILLASLILLFFGLALKFSYYIDYFDFIDTNFKVVPNMLIILGSVMFVVSAISFIGFGTDTKWPYIIISIIMTILSLALLVGVFLTLNMRSSVTPSALSATIDKVEGVQREKYTAKNTSEIYDPKFIENWNFIQKKFRCCGFKSTGSLPYFQYRDAFENNCVPKACCINEKDCKLDRCTWQHAAIKVFNEGCLTVMQRRFTKDLPNHLLMFAIGMAVTAIIGIVNVALAAAFVAQLIRKEKGFDLSQGVREQPPHQLGPDPINMTCPKCQANIKPKIETSTSGKGWAIGIGLCIIGCIPCCLIPCFMDSMKNTKHSCPKCGAQLGTFTPWQGVREQPPHHDTMRMDSFN